MNEIGENDALFENLNMGGHLVNSQIIGFKIYLNDFQQKKNIWLYEIDIFGYT